MFRKVSLGLSWTWKVPLYKYGPSGLLLSPDITDHVPFSLILQSNHQILIISNIGKEQWSSTHEFMYKRPYIWGHIKVIDQACSVKTAGYWPSSFFACLSTVFIESRPIYWQKRERDEYTAISTEQPCSLKDYLCDFREKFSCGTHRAVPSGRDSGILPAWEANQSTAFVHLAGTRS